jgi:hypothetical protein
MKGQAERTQNTKASVSCSKIPLLSCREHECRRVQHNFKHMHKKAFRTAPCGWVSNLLPTTREFKVGSKSSALPTQVIVSKKSYRRFYFPRHYRDQRKWFGSNLKSFGCWTYTIIIRLLTLISKMKSVNKSVSRGKSRNFVFINSTSDNDWTIACDGPIAAINLYKNRLSSTFFPKLSLFLYLKET